MLVFLVHYYTEANPGQDMLVKSILNVFHVLTVEAAWDILDKQDTKNSFGV